MTEISKAYEPQSVEDKWYQFWLDEKFFVADEHSAKPAYSIVIPPPNVTGVLTLGHVLNNTIQDILCRKARMDGKEVLWLPGTDHAGIATQTVVERTLKKAGEIKHRDDLGREKFLERVWEWKEKHGGIIIQQLKKLGASCDWTRERFTMDPEYSRCVQRVFVDLYKKGLIYRGKRMVNWCPASLTALSDEEVTMKEQRGFMYYFKVEVAEAPGTFLTIATTRPETIPGDSAVAVNPKDPRYAHLIGKHVLRPLPVELSREQKLIPIIGDEHVDFAFGTGVLKVTPAHDKADFEIGARHKLAQIEVIDAKGHMNTLAGASLAGLERFKARKVAVELLTELGAMVKEDPYTNNVGYSERADVPVEPRLSEQWFLKYPSVEKSRECVELGSATVPVADSGVAPESSSDKFKFEEQASGVTPDAARETRALPKMQFHPQRWAKVYDHWMGGLQDWCVSRQLWWGHRIPVWYRKSAKTGTTDVFASGADSGLAKTPVGTGSDPVEMLPTRVGTGLDPAGMPPTRVGTGLDPAGMPPTSVGTAPDPAGMAKTCVFTSPDPAATLPTRVGTSPDPAAMAKTRVFASADPAGPAATSVGGSSEASGAADIYVGIVPPSDPENWTQDPDVLDTWFSSWLWPFATMGWPEKTPTLAKFYPTTDLVTGPDIIFFWVARMIMAGYEYMGELPFQNVYFTGIIRDKQGRKMSKSLGNSPDPLDLIAKFGADALRFGVMRAAPLGQDILFDEQNVELGRNFCNKLWNACRFRQMQGGEVQSEIQPMLLTTDDKWILLKLDAALREVTIALNEYKFSDATAVLYRFFWSEYCDWYVEATKAVLRPAAEASPAPLGGVRAGARGQNEAAHEATTPPHPNPLTPAAPGGEGEARKANTLAVIDFVLSHTVRMFHPFLPFITEELWHGMGYATDMPDNQGGKTIMFAPWPMPLDDEFRGHYGLDDCYLEMGDTKYDLVSQGRNLRRAANIGASKKIKYIFKPVTFMPTHEVEVLKLLLNAESVEVVDNYVAGKGTLTVRTSLGELHLPTEGLIDVAAEQARLNKELEKIEAEIAKVEAKLANPSFTGKVPVTVLQEHQLRLAEWQGKRDHVKTALAALS